MSLIAHVDLALDDTCAWCPRPAAHLVTDPHDGMTEPACDRHAARAIRESSEFIVIDRKDNHS